MKGSCLCGNCSFELTGEPGPVGKCHCTKCQKVSGTASNAVFWVPLDNLNWLTGETNTMTFAMADGWGTVRCKDCGSPLPALISDQLWVVPAGLMDDVPQVGIRGHIWMESNPCWERIGDNAPQFAQQPPLDRK